MGTMIVIARSMYAIDSGISFFVFSILLGWEPHFCVAFCLVAPGLTSLALLARSSRSLFSAGAQDSVTDDAVPELLSQLFCGVMSAWSLSFSVPTDTRVTKHQDVPRLSRETWVRHLNRSQSNLLQAAAIPMPWKIFGPHAGQLPAVD